VKKKLLVIFFLLPFFSIGQNTWVQKLSYSNDAYLNDDSVTGVINIQEAADGSVYLFASLNKNQLQKIYKFFPNSHDTVWVIDGGLQAGTMSYDWTTSFSLTADSGIVTAYHHYNSWNTSAYVRKYSKDGILEWQRQIGTDFWSTQIYDVREKNSGGYYAMIEDSLFELDSSGTIIDSMPFVAGRKFMLLPAGDFLVLTSNDQLERVDITGNVSWSFNCSGAFAYFNGYVFISNGNTQIQKIDAATGNQLWNNDYGFTPISDIVATPTGGCLASVGYKPQVPGTWNASACQGVLFETDSIGDTLWTRVYSFPHFGLSSVHRLSNGYIIAGGCYLSGVQWFFPHQYSAFCCRLNADGTQCLLQTDYVHPGDANHDHLVSFVDDALETALSLGQTGIARDSCLDGFDPYYFCDIWDIAVDWNSYTTSGVYSKYADFDGNGVIDTNDLIQFTGCAGDSFPISHRIGENEILNTEEFCLVPVDSIVAAGSPAFFYIILGNNLNPVDSIYGLAFTFVSDFYGPIIPDSSFIFNTPFGTQGVDLISIHRAQNTNYFDYTNRAHTLICRTDYHNAVNVNDTIGMIRFWTPIPNDTISPKIYDFKGVLSDGTVIPFNICMGSVIVDSSFLNVQEDNFSSVYVYPNPADKELKIKNEKLLIGEELIVEIFNLPGEKIKTIQNFNPDQSISVSDLQDGYYLGKISSVKSINSFSFIVQH
jgi:hypothetical protein